MLMIDFATPSLAPFTAAPAAFSRNISPSVRPSVPTRPTKRNSRREGRQEWSGLLHQEHPEESRIFEPFLPEILTIPHSTALFDGSNQPLFNPFCKIRHPKDRDWTYSNGLQILQASARLVAPNKESARSSI